jgi:hypothetical protein
VTDLSNLVKLDDIAEQYFSLTPNIARRKAALGTLPVAAFRLSGGPKGPIYVRKGELDAHVEQAIKQAEDLNSRMRAAGAV